MTANKIRILAMLMAMMLALPFQTRAQDTGDPQEAISSDTSLMPGLLTPAQMAEADSQEMPADTTDTLPPKKNPKLAGWLSFAIPGAGQVYNGQYWKVPIIYGGLGTLIYVSQFYGTRCKQLKNDEKYFLGDTIASPRLNLFGLTNESDIVGYMKKYRRYRDLCYVGMALVYIMNIFDAVVDAHLYDYDVSDDIALRIEPCATNPVFAFQKPAIGARLVLRF